MKRTIVSMILVMLVAFGSFSTAYADVTGEWWQPNDSGSMYGVLLPQKASVREKCDVKSTRIRWTEEDEIVIITGYQDGWYRIQDGFIQAKYVRIVYGKLELLEMTDIVSEPGAYGPGTVIASRTEEWIAITGFLANYYEVCIRGARGYIPHTARVTLVQLK